MYGSEALTLLVAALLAGSTAPTFSGRSALEYTQKVVEFGPRPIGSPAHRQLELFILKELKSFGCQTQEDTFTAQTPTGPVRMNNIIAHTPGRSGRAIVISGHYDTKIMPGMKFVGANDGGSSAGFLLEVARVLCRKTNGMHDVKLVWLDGEEAVQNWTDTDSLYGSRHLANRWAQDGTAKKILALINVDMIGDKDLHILEELMSTDWLRKLFRETALELGFEKHLAPAQAVADDHLPFLEQGIPSLDLIDFDYGPGNSYWHTDRDTVDKLSANSFEVVGRIVLRMKEKLEK